MEKEKKSSKENFFWFFQILAVMAAAGMIFFNFLFLRTGMAGIFSGYGTLAANILLAVFLIASTSILINLFSDFKRGRKSLGEETERKSHEIEKFDKITRQIVKRELELARANQRLSELDKAKSDFVSIAAHQLRTPLTGIKWSYTALLDEKTGPLNAEQKELLESGLAAITGTIDLINDLLNIAHIEEGKYEFKFEKLSLAPIAQKAVAAFKMVTDEKKIALSAKIPEAGLPEFDMDGEKMSLALTNILDNAVKYTPEGGRIDFTVGQEPGLVKIVIEDSGIGIPKNQKSRLFTKFFRAENAVSVQTAGTGLGLYMVKKIIDRHGGKIAVESTEGRGTTFIITLPVSQKS